MFTLYGNPIPIKYIDSNEQNHNTSLFLTI